MISSYAQKSSVVQNVAGSKVSSVFDKSLQSEALQRKADMANNAAQREEAPRPNNTGMPDNLKSGIESLSGFSMDDVRVHYNSSKPATVQALAYTQGTDIHVAPGQEKHLPHEAWHVAQQMAGRVSPTTNINGMPVNDNAALEHEADVMGEKAVQRWSESSNVSKGCVEKVKSGIIQKFSYDTYNEAGDVVPVHVDSFGDLRRAVKDSICYDPKASFWVYEILGGKIEDEKYDVVNIRGCNTIGDVISQLKRFDADRNARENPVENDPAQSENTTAEVTDANRKEFDYSIYFDDVSANWLKSSTKNHILVGQINSIKNDKLQGSVKADKNSLKRVFYHIQNHYPSTGKPLWILSSDEKIHLWGMYGHPGDDKIYNLQLQICRDAPNKITIKG